MPQKRRDLSRRELLESRLSELVDLVKDLSPQSQVAISHAQYEDEDAHVSVYPPPTMEAEEAVWCGAQNGRGREWTGPRRRPTEL